MKILESQAYWKLTNHHAVKMLHVFLDKRLGGNLIDFTYDEGNTQFGIGSACPDQCNGRISERIMNPPQAHVEG